MGQAPGVIPATVPIAHPQRSAQFPPFALNVKRMKTKSTKAPQ
jgi:hypothetical protein